MMMRNKNHSEYIKNLLVAKLDIINQTVKGLDIDSDIHRIETWKVFDDIVSELNSPMNYNSHRGSSKMESGIAPFFGLASTHKTHSGSDHSRRRPFMKNGSF